MPYREKKIATANGEKAYEILLKTGYSMRAAQRLIDRARLISDGTVVKGKNQSIFGDVYLITYECEPRGLRPCFEADEFAVFEKESGVLTHPNGRACEYSLNDEIISLFGESAKVAHRLDKETSGLILVVKNKEAEVAFKKMFENQEVKKQYLALVRGRTPSEFKIDANLLQNSQAPTLKNKMLVVENDAGKSSTTKFELVKYLDKFDISYLLCTPKTGRQHQIRAHLNFAGHTILGDTMYGVSDEFACAFLDGKVSSQSRAQNTGARRLLLHSNLLEFEWKGQIYSIKSKLNIYEEFLKEVVL